MTDLTLQTFPGAGVSVTVDSLAANEFRVEIEGQPVGGVLRISGLTPFKLDIKSANALRLVKDPLTLVKLFHSDPNNPFNEWIRDSIEKQTDIARPKRTLTIVAVDEGVERRRWTIKGAWLSEVRYSEFNSAAYELVEETLIIQWDEVNVSWMVG